MPPWNDPPPSTAAAVAVPKGRALELGADATFDITDRRDGEEQPQLEVSPITMYVTEYAERYVRGACGPRISAGEKQQSGIFRARRRAPDPLPLEPVLDLRSRYPRDVSSRSRRAPLTFGARPLPPSALPIAGSFARSP